MFNLDGLYYEMGIFIYIYVFILLLTTIEFGVRKKMQLGTISHTPALTVGWAVMMVRSVLLICALPFLHPSAYVVSFFTLSYILSTPFSTFYYFKVTSFSLWIFLVILKAFFEKKYLSTKSAVVTVVFAVPVIGFLYLIYTYFF